MKSKFHTLQQDQSDCGVACLKAVLNYFDAKSPGLERLREISGTNKRGTTLLGLLQAAKTLKIEAEGFRAETKHLKECENPCILHIINNNYLQHYVVFYKYDETRNEFLIGDPSSPELAYWSEEKLVTVWKSGALLRLKPSTHMEKKALSNKRKWAWLKTLVKEDIPILSIALCLGLGIAILGLSTAIFSQKLLDSILPEKDFLRLIIGTIALFILLISKGFLSYLRSIFLLKQSRDFNLRIIDRFYSRLLHLPKSFFDNRKTGDLIARMNDTRRIQQTVSIVGAGAMIDLLLILCVSVAIFTYDWAIGLLSLSWFLIFGIIVYFFHPKILRNQRAVMKSHALNESNYIDTIQGIEVIKVKNKQNLFAQSTKTIYGFFQNAIFSLGKVGTRYQLWTEIAGTLLLTLIILWSALNVVNDNLSIGAMIALLQLVGILMTSASSLANLNIQLQEARVAFERIYEFGSIDYEYSEESLKTEAQITELVELRVDQLQYRFPGRSLLLKDISFNVQKGQMLCLMGESGSGKTTLLQILQKFYLPSDGHIKANGIDLTLVSYEQWRSKIGVVPQEIKLFNGTLLDNILLGEKTDNIPAIEAFFQKYKLDPYFRSFPNSYGTLVGESGINLSGGQKQIIGLARALYHKPELLLLDEPTAAMDRNTEKFVLNLLHQIKKDTAILMLTHRLSTAMKADQIMVLEKGSIVARGKHQELLKHKENLYAYAWNDLFLTSPSSYHRAS